MRIITISREFASGGRELGKRLADALGIPCYDKEIIAEVAKMHNISPEHVKYITEADISRVYTSTISGTLTSSLYYNSTAVNILSSQRDVIRGLAEAGDCVIIGRLSDVLLDDMSPFKIFVYSDMKTKLKRCREHGSVENEKLLIKQMKQIDKNRAGSRRFMSEFPWGDRRAYNLMISTAGIEVKSLIEPLVQYVNNWFEHTNKS